MQSPESARARTEARLCDVLITSHRGRHENRGRHWPGWVEESPARVSDSVPAAGAGRGLMQVCERYPGIVPHIYDSSGVMLSEMMLRGA